MSPSSTSPSSRRPGLRAGAEAGRIAAHWANSLRRSPRSINGRVLLLGRRELVEPRRRRPRPRTAAISRRTYADYVAWRDVRPSGRARRKLLFDGGVARRRRRLPARRDGAPHAKRGTDLLSGRNARPDGRLRRHGRPRRQRASRAIRGNGLAAPRRRRSATGWTVVFAPGRVACMKRCRLRFPPAEAKARIDAFLARDPMTPSSRASMSSAPPRTSTNRARRRIRLAYLRAALKA